MGQGNRETGTCEKIRICLWQLTKILSALPKNRLYRFLLRFFSPHAGQLPTNQFFHRFRSPKSPVLDSVWGTIANLLVILMSLKLPPRVHIVLNDCFTGPRLEKAWKLS